MSVDRRAVVDRHRVRITEPHPEHVVSVGNGDFAYTADITGMQTFGSFHDPVISSMNGGVAVNTTTMASWGWHEMPNPDGFVLEDAMTSYDTPRGPVSYPDKYDMSVRGEIPEELRAGTWLHVNPQRIDLGRIGLVLRETVGGEPATRPDVLTETTQELDLWTGIATSSFRFADVPVTVETAATGGSATAAFRVSSALFADGRARIVLRFPYAHNGFLQTDDWDAPEKHTSVLEHRADGTALIRRRLDETEYTVGLAISGGDIAATDDPHVFEITATGDQLELVAAFAPEDATVSPGYSAIAAGSTATWERFWASGAAIDFAGSTDARARGARAPRGALAVPHRGALRRLAATGRDRPARQLVAGQVPPRDALLARRALRDLGTPRASRTQPRLVPVDPRRPGRPRPTGLSRAPAGRSTSVRTAARVPSPSARFSSGSSRTCSTCSSSSGDASAPERRSAGSLARVRGAGSTRPLRSWPRSRKRRRRLPPACPGDARPGVLRRERPPKTRPTNSPTGGGVWRSLNGGASAPDLSTRIGLVGGAERARASAHRRRPLHRNRNRAVSASG